MIGARAIIRDNHEGAAGMKSMAASLTGQGAIGVACPLVGGLTAQYFGWHATIGVVAGFGALAWLAVYAGFTETYARPVNGGTAGFASFFRHRQFVACSLLAGLSFSGALAFLLLSPFVFIGEFGMSKLAYGAMPALCCLAYLLGTVACGYCLRRWSVPKVVRLGASLSLLGAASQFLLWKLGVRGVWSLALPQCVYMLGHGFQQPMRPGGGGGAVSGAGREGRGGLRFCTDRNRFPERPAGHRQRQAGLGNAGAGNGMHRNGAGSRRAGGGSAMRSAAQWRRRGMRHQLKIF